MSTKIYNGYKLPNFNFKELSEFFHNNCNFLREMAENQSKKDIIQIAVRDLDGHTLKGTKDRYLDKAWKRVLKEHQGRQTSEYDYRCEIGCKQGRNKILALLFCGNRTLTEAWESIEGVEPYPYWNNTDHPEEMTRKQWEARGKEWDVALGESSTPSHSFLFFMATPEIHLPYESKLLKEHVPTINARAKHLAEDLLAADKIKVEDGKNPFPDVWAYWDWLKTPEGKEALQAKADEIAVKLIPNITLNDLCGSKAEE